MEKILPLVLQLEKVYEYEYRYKKAENRMGGTRNNRHLLQDAGSYAHKFYVEYSMDAHSCTWSEHLMKKADK